MLSGASKTTTHKVFPVQFCPRRYSWDNIAQIKILCSIVQEAPNNIAHVKTLCNVVLEAPDNSAHENVLFNVVLIIFVQHGTGHNPMQCCPRSPRQYCMRKNSVQCCLNNLGTTFHRSKSYVSLVERLQETLHRTNLVQCCHNTPGIILHRKKLMQFCSKGSRQHCIKKPCLMLA